jgi:hypothetical protein
MSHAPSCTRKLHDRIRVNKFANGRYYLNLEQLYRESNCTLPIHFLLHTLAAVSVDIFAFLQVLFGHFYKKDRGKATKLRQRT